MSDDIAARIAADHPNETEVVAAGAAAAAAEPDPTRRQAAATDAVLEKAEEKGVHLDKGSAQMIARMVVDDIEERGGFDTPEPPIAAPAAPATPAPAGETPITPPAAEQPPEPPRKRTFAERFRGA